MLTARRAPALALALFALALLAPGAASALSWPDGDFVALPCRPTVACTADIVAPGQFELELGYGYRQHPGVGVHRLPFLLKFSMFTWLQLQVSGGGLHFVEGDMYFEDLVAGLKFHVLDQGEYVPSVAITASMSVPLREDSDFYQRSYHGLFILHASKQKSIVRGDFNLGLNALSLNTTPLVQVWGALVLSVALPNRFAITGEVWAQNDALPVVTRDAGALFALSWAPLPWLVLDAGADLGLMQDIRQYTAFAGLTIVPLSFYSKKKEGD